MHGPNPNQPKPQRISGFLLVHFIPPRTQARGRQGDVEYSIDVRGERRTDQSSQVEDLFLPDIFVVKIFLAEDMHGL